MTQKQSTFFSKVVDVLKESKLSSSTLPDSIWYNECAHTLCSLIDKGSLRYIIEEQECKICLLQAENERLREQNEKHHKFLKVLRQLHRFGGAILPEAEIKQIESLLNNQQ